MSTPHDTLLTDLHATHRPRLERLLARRVGDTEAAADLVSEAFARLHDELRADRVPDRPEAWLTRVALNLMISEARHRRVVEGVAARVAIPPNPSTPADEVVDRDELRRVTTALAALSDPDRELILEAAAGASGADLGTRYGLTVGCVRVRLHRARHRLRVAVSEST